MKTICIIGAGMAGLCAARHAVDNGFSVTVFEQNSEIGGTWVYSDKFGKNEYGINIHTSMYKGLRTNLPKEIMGFPDFPIPDQKKSYIPAEDILSFLNLYADEFKICKHIKFLHHVLRVDFKNNIWEVIVKNLRDDSIRTELFDYVLVCNGHYHTPAYSHIKGVETFTGQSLHSHDYRNPELFKGEDVLVIGAGPSGMDIAYEVSKCANSVILSHHLPENPNVLSQKIIHKPDIHEINNESITFSDGTVTKDISVIIHCTGYKYAFPFLSIHCGIHVDDNFVQPLYKHCINIHNPSMAFIGLPFYVCAAQMMDLQVRFVMEYYTGRKMLPSKEQMLLETFNEMELRWKKGYKKRQAHLMGPEQDKYYYDLSMTAGIQNVKPVMTKLHNESSECFLKNLATFRNDIFKIIDNDNFSRVSTN